MNDANKVDSLLLRFSEWERAKNDRRADAQYEALLQEAAELTFSPEISKLSQQIESRLPDDIKSALRSVDGAYTDMPGGNYLDPETSYERREEMLRNFLLRQAKGRAEREKKIDFAEGARWKRRAQQILDSRLSPNVTAQESYFNTSISGVVR